jgi:hypothetical protein
MLEKNGEVNWSSAKGNRILKAKAILTQLETQISS